MKQLVYFLLFISQFSLSQTLTSVSSFGSNPGALSMYTHIPTGVVGPAPIVVVLHGCTQTAQQAADQTGWNKLADANKFYVIYPEQSILNNNNRCFNWFLSGDQEKNQGENLSIKQMVDYMKANYSIDNSKIFATGLSAGAAMTEILCATYPEVFSGGAVMAGGPYKSATTVFEASSAMSGFVNKTPSEWSTLVFAENPGYSGNYPKMAFFHGTADPVVNINNLSESVEQWTAVHQTDQTTEASISNYNGITGITMNSYHTSPGNEVVRTYTINSFGHAISLDTGACLQQGGQTATYAYDINFHSTWHAAHFFGLVDTTATTLTISGPTIVSTNQTNVNYSVSSNTGSTYNWFIPSNAAIASGQGTNSINVNFGLGSILLSVSETMSSGCLNGPESIWVDMCTCNGLEDEQNNLVKIFINDNKTIFIKNIKVKNTSIKIYNLLGSEIFRQITSDESVSLQLPETVSEGVYIIEVSSITNLINKKIIIR